MKAIFGMLDLRAGNIIFAQSFKPQSKKRESVKKRSEVMERRLKLLEERGLFRTVEREKYSSLFDFYDIETVVDTLIKSSAGVYFFQSDPDPDGLQRKYPLVGLYENRIFPSASLAIALKHYGVSFEDVEIVPGKHIRFNLPEPDEHGRSEISIPVNSKGQMQVNWAGNWQDKETGEFDLVHYPYNVLKEFQEDKRISSSCTAYVGDDINDIVVRPLVSLLFAPHDASSLLINISDMRLSKSGGSGAIRELANRILKAKNTNKIRRKFERAPISSSPKKLAQFSFFRATLCN